MKKEARLRAEKMYVKAGGKITNREIANLLKVNALTIGRWKKAYNWDTKLRGMGPYDAKDGNIVRKKAARDKAVRLYMESAGNITNKDLAVRVGVAPATISKWKELDNWIEKLQPDMDIQDAEYESHRTELDHDLGLDLAELASPEQIIEINRRIDILLKRDHLSSGEIADLAVAKSGLLDAVEIYLSIVREVQEREFRQ